MCLKEDIKMGQTSLFKEEEKKIKLKDEKGFFILDNVKINYNFEGDKYGRPHIDFNSAEEKKPNLISETGYRSWFIEWDLTESVVSSVRELIEMFCEAEFSNKHPNYELKFEEEKEFEEIEKNSDWNDIQKLTKKCEKEDEPYSYAFVRYNCDSDLTGKKEYLDISDAVERRRGELGSSSGCGNWIEFETEKDIEEFKQELLQIRKRVCDKPYTKEKCIDEGGGDNLFLTDIKIENTLVSFSEKAREFLERNGFSVDEFYKEFNALKQKTATKEELKKSKTFYIMEKQVDKLKDTCWAIKGYFDECCFLPTGYNRNKKHYYSDKLKEFKIDTSDLNKLRDLYIKKANTYKILYNKVHLQRFGEKPSEEYSYP